MENKEDNKSINNKSSINDVSDDVSAVASNNYIENKNVNTKPRVFEEITRPKALWQLQVMIYYDTLYSFFFFFWVIILFIYKGLVLPYPPGTIGPEVVAFFFYMIIQLIRIQYVSKGNKTQSKKDIIVSAILSIPVFMGYVYLIRYQTYSLVFDLGLNIFSIGFLAIEVLLSLLAITKF